MSSSAQELTEVIRQWTEVFMQRNMLDFRKFREETGLSFAQISVLMRLHHKKDCGVSHLGKHLGVTNAAASQLIDRLVQMGYVARQEDPNDRRAKKLSLTPQGNALIENSIRERMNWLEDLANSISPEQRAHVIEALILLTEAARTTFPARNG